MTVMKTHYTTWEENQSAWHVVDAEGKVLGRLATEIATLLRGKHKPTFSPSVDTGDHVIVLNADKIVLTGRKPQTKVYRHHTGYPGGLREASYQEMMEKHPERVVSQAVWGMLPKNRLGRKQIKKLKVYIGCEHKHEAQKPVAREV